MGTGEEQTAQEYVFEGGQAYKPNLDQYFSDNPDEIDAFVADVEAGRSMAEFFDSAHDYASYAAEAWVSEGEIGGSPIRPFIKTRGEEPYIPGSSLKGAIRTALACQVLREDGNLDEFNYNNVERLFTLQYEGFPDPQRDILRCLTVRDATLTRGTDLPLALCEVKTYSLTSSGEMRSKHWSNYIECLQPGTTLTSEIHVDVDELEAMIDEYGHRDTAQALFGCLPTEEMALERIQEALKNLGTAIVEKDSQLTGEFEAVESFYDNLTGFNVPSLRVGFGTGWHSNTIGTALRPGELLAVRADNRLGKPTFHEDCSGILAGDDRNPGRLFCKECYTGNISPDSEEVSSTPFPKTRRFVRRNGQAEYPLGWTTFEIRV